MPSRSHEYAGITHRRAITGIFKDRFELRDLEWGYVCGGSLAGKFIAGFTVDVSGLRTNWGLQERELFLRSKEVTVFMVHKYCVE